MDIIFLKRKDKENKKKVIIDIGSESVKTILVETSQDKNKITNACVKYFDEYEPQSLTFNEKAIKDSLVEVGWDLLKEKKRGVFNFFLTLSSMFLKSQIADVCLTLNQFVDRKKEVMIFDSIKEIAKKKIVTSFENNYGIPIQEIFFVNLKIINISIDGYHVDKLAGYFCKEVEAKVLGIFLFKKYSEEIKNYFIKIGVDRIKVMHQLEGIFALSKTYFYEQTLFLDIGGKITDVFLLTDTFLGLTTQFNVGSENFSYEISQRIGVPDKDARFLKERYTKNELSLEVSTRIKDFLTETAKIWFNELKNSFNRGIYSVLPSNICVSGGGALLPSITEILESGEWKPLDFISEPKVKFIYPEIFKEVEIPDVILRNPQFTNSLLIYYAQESY